MSEVVKGCGIDIIEIERIARALKKPGFINKIHTSDEQKMLHTRHNQSWAVRFAAKEAVMKAIGCGWQKGVRFKDIEINQDQWGKPVVLLSGRVKEIADARKITQLHISLAHDRISAIAYAIAVGRN